MQLSRTLVVVIFLAVGCTESAAYGGHESIDGWSAIFYGCGKTTHYLVLFDREDVSGGKSYLETGCRASRESVYDRAGVEIMKVDNRGRKITINREEFSLDNGRVFVSRLAKQPAATTQHQIVLPEAKDSLHAHIKEFLRSEPIASLRK